MSPLACCEDCPTVFDCVDDGCKRLKQQRSSADRCQFKGCPNGQMINEPYCADHCDDRPYKTPRLAEFERDANRYRRIRENWIDCDEIGLHGRLSVVDARIDDLLKAAPQEHAGTTTAIPVSDSPTPAVAAPQGWNLVCSKCGASPDGTCGWTTDCPVGLAP